MNTPQDIYDYVVRSGKESDFLSAIMLQREQYSIAEIPDAVFAQEADGYYLQSEAYHLHLPVRDPEILAAVQMHVYISAFLSRHVDQYQVHFLVHSYPAAVKAQFEDEIARQVVRYMILKTIVALRLTTWKKVDAYLGTAATL